MASGSPLRIVGSSVTDNRVYVTTAAATYVVDGIVATPRCMGPIIYKVVCLCNCEILEQRSSPRKRRPRQPRDGHTHAHTYTSVILLD